MEHIPTFALDGFGKNRLPGYIWMTVSLSIPSNSQTNSLGMSWIICQKQKIIMKSQFLLISLLSIFIGCNQVAKTPINQLKEVEKMLNQHNSFEYLAFHDVSQEGMIMNDTISVFIEKSDEESPLPIKYIFKSPSGEFRLFDGQHISTIINAERTLVKTENPPEYLVVSNQGLIFSPYFIQRYLKYLFENDEAAITFLGDTLAANKNALAFEITTDYLYLPNGQLVKNGDLLPNQIKAENIRKKYLLTIDPESNLPISMKEIYENEDYVEVSFIYEDQAVSSFEERAKEIANPGFLTLSTEEYMQIQMSKQQDKVGSLAEDFTLPLIPQSEFTLSKLKGSPVLLEFWFPGCAFCLEAIPAINSIFEKYQPDGLQVCGIEFSDASEERISKYIKNQDVRYPIAYLGKSQSIKYGVNSGPSLILLDKNHQIVHSSSGLNEQELISAIEKVL